MNKRLTKAIENETLTEDLIINWLNNEQNIYAPGDQSVKFARQFPLGSRRPDFFTYLNRDGKCPIAIIIEAKKDNITNAEIQVKEYMEIFRNIDKDIPVIGIGAALATRKSLKLSSFWYNEDTIVPLKSKQDIKYISDQIEKEAIVKKKIKEKTWKDKLAIELAQLHEHVRNYCKAPANEKINLLNGVFIALRSNDYRAGIPNMRDEMFSKNIFTAINTVMMYAGNAYVQKQNIADAFAFLNISTSPINDLTVPSYLLNNPRYSGEMSFAKFVCLFISEKILKPLEEDPAFKDSSMDVSSVVYNEFIRYSKSDGKDLGIVLTPEHISDFMVDLLEIKFDDKVLDLCTGSGAFLISAMKHKQANAATPEELAIAGKGLIGVEQQPHMYALAMANLLFNGADISDLHLGSCYEHDIIQSIINTKPTKAVLNPPYAMCKSKDSDLRLHEWGFTLHALNFMPQGAKVAVIIPTSCGIHNEEVNNNFKQEIMAGHTLDYIIQCPDQLFYPVGVICNIYIFTAGIPHKRSHTTFTYNLKDDGFKISRKLGRVNDGSWLEKKKLFMNTIENFEITNLSNKMNLKSEDEWDYSPANICPNLDYKTFQSVKDDFEAAILKTYSTENIEVKSWEKFNIMDLFNVSRGNSKESKTGKPLITCITSNNGRHLTKLSNNGIVKNVITVSGDGTNTGTAFYQNEEVGVFGNVNILKLKDKDYTKNIALFLCAVMTKTFSPRYNYGKKLGLARLIEESIYLPSKNNQPDWEYMENFMNNLIEN